MVAKLIESFKQYVTQGGKSYIADVNIWWVDDKRYRDNIKYSLVFIEPFSGRKVLMDNHHPKNPHVHLDDEEFDYEYKNTDLLIDDFKKFVLQHFGVVL